MEWIWEVPESKWEYQFAEMIECKDSFSREDAIRRHIPDLGSCTLNCLCRNQDSVGSLICFDAGKNNFKEVDLSFSFLRSVLCQNLCISHYPDFEHLVSEHSFEERQRNLTDLIYRWRTIVTSTLEFDEIIWDTTYKIKVLNDELNFLQYYLAMLSNCSLPSIPFRLIIDSKWDETFADNKDLRHIVRYLCEVEEKGDVPESIENLTERIVSCCAELELYERKLDDLTADLRRKQDYLSIVSKSSHMRAAVIKRKPFSNEEAINFALRQPCYLDHVRNLVGDSNRIYLLVFSSKPGSTAHRWLMDKLGDWLDRRLNACCRKVAKVFYFDGKFAQDTNDSGTSR